MKFLLRTALLVCQLNLIGVGSIVAVAVVGPAVVDLEVELVSQVLQVHGDSQVLPDLDRAL